MNQNLTIAIYSLTTSLLLFNSNIAHATCDITRAVYTDVDRRGYELRFSNPSQDSAVSFATVTLWHPQRGNLGTFEVGSSQGIGEVYFSPKSDLAGETNYRISAYFFSSDFRQFNQQGASPHMFVSGLGSWDWYANQMSGSRDVFLGNPMWKLNRCR